MQKLVIFLFLLSPLAGCALLSPDTAPAQTPTAAPTATVPDTINVTPLARSAAALDSTTEAERNAALVAGPGQGAELGRVTVTLGNPTEQGFWLRSPLVTAPGKGRVVTDQGASVSVDLLPGTSGAQLSLAAFRALGLPLTGLPSVTVFTEN